MINWYVLLSKKKGGACLAGVNCRKHFYECSSKSRKERCNFLEWRLLIQFPPFRNFSCIRYCYLSNTTFIVWQVSLQLSCNIYLCNFKHFLNGEIHEWNFGTSISVYDIAPMRKCNQTGMYSCIEYDLFRTVIVYLWLYFRNYLVRHAKVVLIPRQARWIVILTRKNIWHDTECYFILYQIYIEIVS